ncbi:MAG: efflux RND transporter periplasmic adaptor subunit [Thermodesulfobacteriota bacterium]|nr:efflux RND transporter periplasmic adaptor subunit [Thermodesulfobacteriota bacterium]
MRYITKQPKLRTPLIFMAVIILAILTGCSRDGSKEARAEDPRKAPVPVTIVAAEEKSVPIELRAVGNVRAFSTVSVKAQVGGELIAVHFKEGQEVKCGDLLFTIDPAPFEAHLKQAEANLAKHQAELQNAQKQVERYGSVVKKGYVSKENYDQVSTDAIALEAGVLADKAAVENAKLDLKYCYIRSPITGYTGELKVHRGNLIKANDNDRPMVTINQTSPIYLAFSIPERNLPEVKRHMKTRKLDVLAEVPGMEARPLRGELASIDNTVDPGTGTIQLKAIFPNRDTSLWPGQFVNVTLTLGKQDAAVIVPSHAVQAGQQGPFVFVVRPDLIAEVRLIVVGRTLGEKTVIDKGIKPGEWIVTDGHLKLFPGAKVKLVKGVE